MIAAAAQAAEVSVSEAYPLGSLEQEGVVLSNDDVDWDCDALVREGASKIHCAHAEQRALVPVLGAHRPEVAVYLLLRSYSPVRPSARSGISWKPAAPPYSP